MRAIIGYAPDVDNPWSILVIDRFNRSPETWQRTAALAGVAANVTVAPDPERAEPLLRPGAFKLVFCSYYFPAETGTQFFSRMRSQGVDTPVIFIATEMDVKGVLEAAEMPMADFLVSPFNPESLTRRISLLVGNNGAQVPAEESAA